MKTIATLFLSCLIWLTVTAQAPQSFNYQAAARDISGNVLANKNVSFRISILRGSATGIVEFSEQHAKTTNAFGLVNLEIGKGSAPTGSFAAINWGTDPYFIKVELDPNGGSSFQSMGTSQLQSVPYALFAREVQNKDDADADPLNEIQALSITGTLLSLSKGGGTVTLPTSGGGDNWGTQAVKTNTTLSGTGTDASPLGVVHTASTPNWTNIQGIPAGIADGVDNVDDADNNITNEIQTLTLTGTQLTLSKEGGTVTLPAAGGGDNWGTDVVHTDATLEGNGKSATPLKIARQSATTGQVLKWNGTSWLPAEDIAGPSFSLPYTGALTDHITPAFQITSSGESAIAIKGNALSGTSVTHGLYGYTNSASGQSVYGFADATSGNAYGVAGKTNSPNGSGVTGEGPYTGVRGVATQVEGTPQGVYGEVRAPMGTGVLGTNMSSSGQGTGVKGLNNTLTGCGVLGESLGDGLCGVMGITSSNRGYALYADARASSGMTYGVKARIWSPEGFSGYFQGGQFYISGNAGIGIEHPAAKLDVNGQVKITGGSPGAGKVLTSDANGLASWQTPAGGLTLPYSGSVSDGYVAFKINNTATDPLTPCIGIHGISTSGIGVKGETTSSYGVYGVATATSGLAWGVYGGVISSAGYSGYFNGGRFYVSGNVGIGKTDPSYKLDVNGDRIRLISGTEWIAMRTDGNTGFLDLSFAGGKLVIQGSTTDENIILNPSMNKVGIRTWTPQYDLDVNGNIRAIGSVYYGGATASANGTAYSKPDFVFDKTYEKLSTDEIEEFLQKEKHLPWVTSVELEKKENGGATDMTRLAFETLESVENLQLQLIQQNNLMKELKAENEELKERLEKLEERLK